MSPRRPLTPGEEILALEILAQETIYGSGTGKPRGILAALEHDANATKSSQSPEQPSPRVSTRTGSGERWAGSEGDDWREGPWTCICGSGDDGEWHTFMCAASNTPDDVFYDRADVLDSTDHGKA